MKDPCEGFEFCVQGSFLEEIAFQFCRQNRENGHYFVWPKFPEWF